MNNSRIVTIKVDSAFLEFLEKKKSYGIPYARTVSKALRILQRLEKFCEPYALSPEKFVNLVLRKFEEGELALIQVRKDASRKTL